MRLGPKTAAASTASRIPGNANRMSIAADKTLSAQPPRHAATSASATPIDGGERDDHERSEHRGASADDQPREEIAALAVEPERVARRSARCRPARGRSLFGWMGCDHGSEEGGDDGDRDHDRADGAEQPRGRVRGRRARGAEATAGQGAAEGEATAIRRPRCRAATRGSSIA